MSSQQNELKALILATITEGKPWPTDLGHNLARLNRQQPYKPPEATPPLTPTKRKPPPASEA